MTGYKDQDQGYDAKAEINRFYRHRVQETCPQLMGGTHTITQLLIDAVDLGPDTNMPPNLLSIKGEDKYGTEYKLRLAEKNYLLYRLGVTIQPRDFAPIFFGWEIEKRSHHSNQLYCALGKESKRLFAYFPLKNSLMTRYQKGFWQDKMALDAPVEEWWAYVNEISASLPSDYSLTDLQLDQNHLLWLTLHNQNRSVQISLPGQITELNVDRMMGRG